VTPGDAFQVGVLIQGLLVAISLTWFAIANWRFDRYLARVEGPEPEFDDQPRVWITRAPGRVKSGFRELKTVSVDPVVENWRIRTIHRWILFLLVLLLGSLLVPIVLVGMTVWLSSEVEHRTLPTDLPWIVIPLGIVAFWCWRLLSVAVTYGNGTDVRAIRPAIDVAALLATVGFLVITAIAPLSR
jgi:hypothetical protein